MSQRPDEDLELERLLAESAPEEGDRELLREAHRQLEKDLLRLADPMPPDDFVQQVMARVEAEPKRLSTREFGTAVAIAVSSLVAASAAFVWSGGSAGALAVSFAQKFISLRELGVACTSGLSAVWRTAGLPLSVALSVVVVMTMFGVRRLVPATKVVS